MLKDGVIVLVLGSLLAVGCTGPRGGAATPTAGAAHLVGPATQAPDTPPPTSAVTATAGPDRADYMAAIDAAWSSAAWHTAERDAERAVRVFPDDEEFKEKLYAARINYGDDEAKLGNIPNAIEKYQAAAEVRRDALVEARLEALMATPTTAPPTPVLGQHVPPGAKIGALGETVGGEPGTNLRTRRTAWPTFRVVGVERLTTLNPPGASPKIGAWLVVKLEINNVEPDLWFGRYSMNVPQHNAKLQDRQGRLFPLSRSPEVATFASSNGWPGLHEGVWSREPKTFGLIFDIPSDATGLHLLPADFRDEQNRWPRVRLDLGQ